jgi:hypothetical protein
MCIATDILAGDIKSVLQAAEIDFLGEVFFNLLG